MSKHKAKVPFSTASRVMLDLTAADWQDLQAAYGQTLAPVVREQVLDASRHYLSMASFEMSAGPMAEAVKRTGKLRKAASSLLTLIEQNSSMAPNAAALHADELIGWYRYERVLHPSKGKEYLKPFASEVSSFLVACESALDEMSRSSSPGYWPDGGAWREWIKTITQIMESNGLPSSARKDTDKNKTGRPSVFVNFMRELQACLRKHYRRHMHSDTALADAINRARPSARVIKRGRQRR
jgi:hypothetical protein